MKVFHVGATPLKRLILFIIPWFFLFVIQANLNAQYKPNYIFLSPDRNCAISVKVVSNNFDDTIAFNNYVDVYLRTSDMHEYKIFKSFFRYEPDVRWLTNDLAEVFVGTGSPGFFKRYIRVSSRKVSPQYNFAVTESPDLKNIIVLDMDKVKIYRLFEENPFKIFVIHGLRPWGNEVKFISANRFYIKNNYLHKKGFYIELQFK